MRVTIVFADQKKRQVKSEDGRYFVLKDGTRIRKSSKTIIEVLHEEDKKIGKGEEYRQNFLDEVDDADKELFGNIPAEDKPLCFTPVKEGVPEKKKKASKKSAQKGE